MKASPLKIGITGGIGSGKSVVSRLLTLLGIPVYLCDDAGKRLLATHPDIRTELTTLLGPELYRTGQPDKAMLASYLFACADHAARVNAIVHPRVRYDFHRWVDAHASAPLVAMESAILVEAGFTDEVDVVVMVDAPVAVRVARAARRDATSTAAIEQRVRSQMSDDCKRLHAHHILVNDDTHALLPQVLQLIDGLSRNK